MVKNSIKQQRNMKSSHANGFAKMLVGFYLYNKHLFIRNFFNDHISKLENYLEQKYYVYWYELKSLNSVTDDYFLILDKIKIIAELSWALQCNVVKWRDRGFPTDEKRTILG